MPDLERQMFLSDRRRSSLLKNIYKDCVKVMGKFKKRVVAVLFLLLGTVSCGLTLYGISYWQYDLATLLLSVFVVSYVVYDYKKKRCAGFRPQQVEADEQVVGEMEVMFAVVQLIIATVCFVLEIKKVKNNYKFESLFPWVFDVFVIIFVFRKENEAIDSTELVHLPGSIADLVTLSSLTFKQPWTLPGLKTMELRDDWNCGKLRDLDLIDLICFPFSRRIPKRNDELFSFLQHIEIDYFPGFFDTVKELVKRYNSGGSTRRLFLSNVDHENNQPIPGDDPCDKLLDCRKLSLAAVKKIYMRFMKCHQKQD